ncbi:MAG TPA: RNA 2',3'-cyclic phosphodiesterase [Caulobacteraceae bacterium]|jgi:2'-5' RNA ligase|nr:RNA 2',3'-cyclic phosphodiesterase [Caulobacteraceae bacterium]
MIRLFTALAVPADTAAFLQRLQEGVPGARWHSAERMHVTLRFAGEVSERIADELDAELETITGPALSVRLAGVGAFEEAGTPRAIWAGVELDEPMRILQKRCEAAARRAGLAPEKRVWRPHVTLAYLADADPVRVGQWIQHNNLARAPSFEARSFGLYSSWRSKEGAVYRLERAYPLSSAPRGPSARRAG